MHARATHTIFRARPTPGADNATRLLIFDDRLASLAPLDDLRPTFAVRTGALTTAERLALALDAQIVALDPAPQYEELARELLHHASPDAPIALPAAYADAATRAGLRADDTSLLAVNSRCVLPIDQLRALQPGSMLVERETPTPDAPTGPAADRVVAIRDSAERLSSHVAQLRAGSAPVLRVVDAPARTLLSRPWHWRRSRDPAIATDLGLLVNLLEPSSPAAPTAPLEAVRIILHAPGASRSDIEAGSTRRVVIAPSAHVWPGVTIDATQGHVVIDEHAIVRPGATIIGPAYIGASSSVLDHTLIKPSTAIGPVCKVAGEVGGSIFQGFANKAHDGHLGDSWLGEWVNLGAATTNSNLLNTYSEVIAQATPSARRERTGEVYLGCTLGDHVKAAICTRIMTGAIAHTGVMWAAAEPLSGCVARFRWVTDATGPQGQPFRLDKFIETARTVMARRSVRFSAAYDHAVRALDANPWASV